MAIATIFERVRTHESSKEKLFLLIKIINRVRIDTRTDQGQADANQLFAPLAKLYHVFIERCCPDWTRDSEREISANEKVVLDEIMAFPTKTCSLPRVKKGVL
jgi:hypothetical protein